MSAHTANNQPGDRPEGRGQPSSSVSGGFGGQDDLALRLGRTARSLQEKPDVEDTLAGIVWAAVDNVPGAQIAAISQVQNRRKIETTAWTHELATRVDQAQYETGEGPCLSTICDEATIRLTDTGTDERWPRFTERARKLGIGSMLSIQLYAYGEDLGALNLYNREPDGFSDESEHVGLLLATHAAVAMAGAQRQRRLNLGLEARDVIGQAKGILMERYKISADEAFALLIRASQGTNTKLRDVADHLAVSGELMKRAETP